MTELLKFVGDPFVDCGVAVLAIRVGKRAQDVSDSDLLQQSQLLECEYALPSWRGYLSVHFPNSGWCNPTMAAAKQAEFRELVLRGYRGPMIGRPCAYCGRPAHDLADRSKIPLLTGATVMTSSPGGSPGLPVCGYCLCAIQYYPLATLKVSGRPLFWWSQDPEWMVWLTKDFCHRVRAVLAGSPEAVPNCRWPSTRLLDSAYKVMTLQRSLMREAGRLSDIVGCHVTNYGSGPEYDELRVPKALLAFWSTAMANFPVQYAEIVNSAREQLTKPKTRKKQETVSGSAGEPIDENRRNFFYEDLGRAFRSVNYQADALQIARKYFFRMDKADIKAGAYELARCFLETVAGMTKDRIDAVERIADRIAASPEVEKIVARLFKRNRGMDFIVSLTDAMDRLVRKSEPAFSTADVHLALNLVSEDDATPTDTWLIRELMIMRILETVSLRRPEEVSKLPDVAASESENEKGA